MRGKKDGLTLDTSMAPREMDSDPNQADVRLAQLEPTDGSFRDGNGKLWMPQKFADQMASYQRSAEVPFEVQSSPRDLLLTAKLRRAFQPMRGKKADDRIFVLPARESAFMFDGDHSTDTN